MTVYFQLPPPKKKGKGGEKNQKTISILWRIGTPQKKNVRFSDGPLAMSEFTLCSENHLKHLSGPLTVVTGSEVLPGQYSLSNRPQRKESWRRRECRTFDWQPSRLVFICMVLLCSAQAVQMSGGFNENCNVLHNGRFSARLNVSLCRNFPFLSPPPLCPYCDTAVLPSSLFLKNKVKKIGIKGGVFCVACRRVSPQVSTWNTKVFSYLICIHSHNEWAWLSCFQVRRVQTRLLFALSSDMCMLLPPVQALERSHRLCPGCTPPTPPPIFLFFVSLCMF